MAVVWNQNTAFSTSNGQNFGYASEVDDTGKATVKVWATAEKDGRPFRVEVVMEPNVQQLGALIQAFLSVRQISHERRLFYEEAQAIKQKTGLDVSSVPPVKKKTRTVKNKVNSPEDVG